MKPLNTQELGPAVARNLRQLNEELATTNTTLSSLSTAVSGLFVTGTYTPTLSGMAIGTGGSAANTARLHYANGLLTVQGRIIFGTSGTTFPGSSITATLPSGYTATEFYAQFEQAIGFVTFRDDGVLSYNGVVWLDSTSTVRFMALDNASTYERVAATGTTIPFTWGAGDRITYQFSLIATKA